MAISLTREQAQYRAWVMAAEGLSEQEARLFKSHVGELIDEAVRVLCDRVKNSPNYFRIQSFFTFTPNASGQINLTDVMMADTIDSAYNGTVATAAYKYPLERRWNLRDIQMPKAGVGAANSNAQELGYYFVSGGNSASGLLFVGNADGSPITAQVTIFCCAYQTFDTLSLELEDEFLEVLAEMARAKRPDAGAAA